jgi:hypothetical protein
MNRTTYYVIAIAAVIGSAILLVFVNGIFVTRISPDDEAWTKMNQLRDIILNYAERNGVPPKTIQDISNDGQTTDMFLDAWDRPIEYEVLGDNVVRLISRGKDGLPGGTGAARDFIAQFELRDEKGNWNDSLHSVMEKVP